MQAPTLFCKPLPVMRPAELLFYCSNQHTGNNIAFRSLDMSKDLNTIHDWVNQPYAKEFWQMDMDKQALEKEYQLMLDNPMKHSFIGLFNKSIVCQVDLCNVATDELSEHVDAGIGNCGMHILMCPPSQSIKGLTVEVLKAFIKFYYSFSAAQTLFAEPDINNAPANAVALKAGFVFQQRIELKDKTANLYSITKQQFQNNRNEF